MIQSKLDNVIRYFGYNKTNYGVTEQSYAVDIDQVLLYVTSSSFVLSTGCFAHQI